MKISIEDFSGDVTLTAESDGEGRWTIKGHRLARQDEAVTEYVTEDGLHVLGLLQLYVGANDSREYLQRRLREHDYEVADTHDERDLADSDEFQCDKCGTVGDIDDSIKQDDEYLCPNCATKEEA